MTKRLVSPRATRGETPRHRRRERGQATVEFAFVLPLVVLAVLAVIQVGLVVRDQLGVVHAAREAVRAASVDPDPAAAVRAAHRTLPRADVHVSDRPRVGDDISVTVEYHSVTSLPLVGVLFPDPDLRATATMRVER
ncbi:MAG: TadE/TadG family type IV pilus assembly protein [Acidimicrobiia bacterium]